MENTKELDFPEITLEEVMELSYYNIGHGLYDFVLVAKDTERIDEHRWYCVSDIVFSWRGRLFSTYYYSLLKSEQMDICDIEDLDTKMPLTEVEAKEVTTIVYVKKEN